MYTVHKTSNIGSDTKTKKAVSPRFMKDKIIQFKLGNSKLLIKIEK